MHLSYGPADSCIIHDRLSVARKTANQSSAGVQAKSPLRCTVIAGDIPLEPFSIRGSLIHGEVQK